MIYHFCPRADWEAAQPSGAYAADSLATQGFIHCSPADLTPVSAALFGAGRDDLVLLTIDEARLSPPAVWEDGDPPRPDGRAFPHVYGPIPVDAVVAVRDYRPAPDGGYPPVG